MSSALGWRAICCASSTLTGGKRTGSIGRIWPSTPRSVGDDGADLRVAARGRVLDAHRDRLDAAGHLDPAHRDDVVDDVRRP